MSRRSLDGARALLPLALATIAATASAQQLDDTWTVTVGGQSVAVSPDGTFVVSNVSGTDAVPDLLSDEFFRLTGIRMAGGVVEYASSAPFQLLLGGRLVLDDIQIGTVPPPLPTEIALTVDDPVIGALGATTQVTTLATLPDGTTQDVTPAGSFTTYRSTNVAIAQIDQEGLVTAIGPGGAFLVATNAGTTATAKVIVSPASFATTLTGFVVDEAGFPVAGAAVDAPLQGLGTTTGADGGFSLPGVLVSAGAVTLEASAQVGGMTLEATSGLISLTNQPLTDAGVLHLSPVAPPARFVYVNRDYFSSFDGNNRIDGYALDANGLPTFLPGAPFLTGGNGGCARNPNDTIVSVGPFVYATNCSNLSRSISGFLVEPDGSLTAVPGSPYQLAAPATVRSLAVHPSGTLLYVGSDFGNKIHVFSILPDGSLFQAHPFVLTSVPGPTNMQMHPSGELLFTSTADIISGFVQLTPISAWRIAPDGSLTLEADLSVNHPWGGTAIHSSGDWLFGASGVSASTVGAPPVGVFGFGIQTGPPASFPLVPGSPFALPPPPFENCTDMVVSPDGAFLYVALSGEEIVPYAVQPDGTLVEGAHLDLSQSQLSNPVIEITPDGTRLYVASSNKVGTVAVDGAGGLSLLSVVGGSNLNAASPTGITVVQ
jgi:hypothetical protein